MLRRSLIVLTAFLIVVGGILFIDRRPDMDSARCVQCVLASIFIAILAWAVRGWLRNALVMLCSLVFGVALLEGATLAMRPSPGPAGAVETDTGLGGGRPVLGWGPTKPGVFRASKVEPNGHVIYDTKVTIDDNLNRKTMSSTGSGPIAFFGDSWVFGAGVNDDGTIPQAFADLNHGKIPVLNLSYSGWSPAQNLAALREGLYKPLLVRPRHFILFAAMFHVERTGCRVGYRFSQAPRFVVDDGKVEYKGACAEMGGKFLMSLIDFVRRFALYDRIAPYFAQPTKRDVETFVKIIEAFVDTAKQDYHVETTVLVPPQGDVYIAASGYTEDQVIEELRKAGVDVLVDRLPKIDNEDLYWISGDGHPTALSNQARARAIEAHLEKVDPNALEVAADTSH